MSRDENNNKQDERCGAAVSGRMQSGVGGGGAARGQGESTVGRSARAGTELQRAGEWLYRQALL
ncbi:hypothetical protein D3C85_1661830 [compost metagenome]